MIKINVLQDVFFTELEVYERIGAIAGCGFKYIESWCCESGDLQAIARANAAHGTELISVAFPAGADIAPVNRENKAHFLARVDELSDYALAAGCRQAIVNAGQALKDVGGSEQEDNLIDALRAAGELAQRKDFSLNLEVLNSKVNHPGCFLDDRVRALRVVKAVGLDNVKMLYDIYHMAIMHGNQTQFISENIDLIGHFHAAGVPGRHELANSEIDYSFLIPAINNLQYSGFFGLEYFPELESSESLKAVYDSFMK